MTNITVYDIEAKEIERLAEKYDVSEAEVVEGIMNALELNEINLAEYI